MSTTTAKAAITTLTDLEALMRRVVREELTRLLPSPEPSILEDWSHEGPEDPAGDEELLAEALVMSQQYKKSKAGWKSWEEFKAELDRRKDEAD